MEVVSIVRALVRHPVLIAIGVVASIALGAALFAKLSTPPRDVVSATSRVLIDARTTPGIDLDPGVANTLGLRAGILADLMMTSAARGEIARAAGVPVGELAVFGPSMDAPSLLLPLAVSATEAAAGVREPYLVRVSARGKLPFLQITASAPTTAQATDLVDAGQASLRNLIESQSERGPGLQLQALGPNITKVTREGSTPILAVFAALGFLGLWCAGIVVASGLARALRRQHELTAAAHAVP